MLAELDFRIDQFKREREEDEAEERRNSVGGVPWAEAPIPPRIHRCYAHTTGWIGFDQIQRCACGAIRNTRFNGWLEKNSRRSDKKPSRWRYETDIPLVINIAMLFIVAWGIFTLYWAWRAFELGMVLEPTVWGITGLMCLALPATVHVMDRRGKL